MKPLSVALSAGCLCLSAQAATLYYADTGGNQLLQQDRSVLAAQFEPVLGEPVVAVGVAPQDLETIYEDAAETRALFVFSPGEISKAAPLGWRQFRRTTPTVQIGLFQYETKPIRVVGTPAEETVVFQQKAKVLGNNPVPVQTFLDHSNCLRAALVGSVDACLTAPYFVAQYKKVFGIEFFPSGELVSLPDLTLGASPQITDAEFAQLLDPSLELTFDSTSSFQLVP